MRKLTALTIALSLSATGQAFAGEPHVAHVAAPHAVASARAEAPKVEAKASADKSAILDTDVAAETANLTRQQILVQAGTSVLSIANSRPQSVLSLIGK